VSQRSGKAKTTTMKVLTGHLTATDKKVAKTMIQNSWWFAETKRTKYKLMCENGVFTFQTTIRDRGMIPCPGSKLRTSTYKSTFTI
jgi:ABC-type hemin transport system ATPase subunit